jgi:hypothetical protein
MLLSVNPRTVRMLLYTLDYTWGLGLLHTGNEESEKHSYTHPEEEIMMNEGKRRGSIREKERGGGKKTRELEKRRLYETQK